jgi:2-polyprenyl-6-methoxyphenol hydroxylase-like FAD-dependent oxidoreductase
LADFDVVIAGAGPAGTATAISLADFAPELRVCIAHAPAADRLRVGETLPPQIKPLLDHLGLWPAFEADRHRPSYRTVSAWGGPEVVSNEFLFQTRQVGWRLDRARFDAMMRTAAASRATCIAARIDAVVLEGSTWRVRLSDGARHSARFVVDATGRGSVVARTQGTRLDTHDRLSASAMLFDDAPEDGMGLLIETFGGGWWYTAALPENRRIVACMSDADLVRALGVATIQGWMRALGETRHLSQALGAARPIGSPALRAAGSRHIAHDTTLPLLCVGDAASCFDPVSGQGIFKALRGGIFASYAIADSLRREDQGPIVRFRGFVKREFESYRQTLSHYYALERRWPDCPFWQRRAGPAAQGSRWRTGNAGSDDPTGFPASAVRDEVSRHGLNLECEGERPVATEIGTNARSS